MSKILVTGGADFIGSHNVDLFVPQGYDVSCHADRLECIKVAEMVH